LIMHKKLSVFISFDIEGISGVSSWHEVSQDSPLLSRIRKLATEEVNTAIKGIRNARKDVKEIVVCDAHAQGENLIVERLEKGVHIVKGSPRNYYMIEGINREFNLLFFIGYHAMAGTKNALMDHTYSSSSIYGIKINDKYVGETEINAAVAGYYGVPLGLVSGDDFLIKEVRRFFGPHVETVITKYGISRFAAKCRHPHDVHEEIKAKAGRAVKKLKTLKPFSFKKPIHAEFDLMNSLIGDVVEPVPGLKRISGRKIHFKAKDILEFYRIMRLVCSLASSI
jgi:D-amino peptidase